jgi:hypothetical protein
MIAFSWEQVSREAGFLVACSHDRAFVPLTEWLKFVGVDWKLSRRGRDVHACDAEDKKSKAE